METFIIYMAKASGLIALFIIAYYIFLKKETFFTSNRWFLIAGLLTAALLPFVTYTKTIWIDPVPQQAQVISIQDILNYQQQRAALASPMPQETSINWFDVIAGVYMAGALFFLLRFILNFLSLRRVIKGQQAIKEDGFTLIDTPRIESPFSFFKYIVYNSTLLSPEELENIICHEKAHSRQYHSIDMLTGQLFCIAFWFNPFAWMYKKSMSQNLEFIADAEAMKKLSDKTSYQKTLLKITVQPSCTAITNHFYQSLIKKRIVMLNKEQSNRRNSWKYAIVLPALTAFILLFQVQTKAQVKEGSPSGIVKQDRVKIAVEINKDTKDSELTENANAFKDDFDANVAFTNVTRNTKSEITGIKVTVKDKTQSQVYEVSGAEPIEPFTIEMEKGSGNAKNNISFGTPGNHMMMPGHAYVITDGDESDTTRTIRARVIQSNSFAAPPNCPSPAVMGYAAPPFPPAFAGSGMQVNFDEDALVVVNGAKQKKGSTISLPMGQQIQSVRMMDPKEAKKKYGKEAKKGAIEITTAPGMAGGFAMAPGRGNTAYTLNLSNPPAFVMADDMTFDFDIDSDVYMKDFNDLSEEDMKAYGISKEEFEELKADLERSKADMEKSREQFANDRVRIVKSRAELDKRKAGSQQEEAEIQQARQELENARKEVEQARKEVEQARKEMAKELEKMKKSQ